MSETENNAVADNVVADNAVADNAVAADTTSAPAPDRLIGRVKWFNNKTGFGFITALEGEHKDRDVFVHHSTIKVSQDQYRYLVLGEYIEFILSKVVDASSKHEFQAADVTGVKGGKLICETRWESRATADEGTSASAGASRFRHATTARSSKPTEDWTTISNERTQFAPRQSGGQWRRGSSNPTRGRGGSSAGAGSAEL
jgi:cold shock CspA family protein